MDRPARRANSRHRFGQQGPGIAGPRLHHLAKRLTGIDRQIERSVTGEQKIDRHSPPRAQQIAYGLQTGPGLERRIDCPARPLYDETWPSPGSDNRCPSRGLDSKSGQRQMVDRRWPRPALPARHRAAASAVLVRRDRPWAPATAGNSARQHAHEPPRRSNRLPFATGHAHTPLLKKKSVAPRSDPRQRRGMPKAAATYVSIVPFMPQGGKFAAGQRTYLKAAPVRISA